MDSRVFFAALALAGRVSRLNPSAGEIGAGMLASLVAEARTIQGYINPKDGAAQVASAEEAAAIYADGLLLREMVALMLPADHDKWETAQDILQGLIDSNEPKDVSGYIAQIRATIEQTNRVHPS